MGRLPDRRLAAQRKWPEGPGEHLTAAGTDGAGRWAVHAGQRLAGTTGSACDTSPRSGPSGGPGGARTRRAGPRAPRSRGNRESCGSRSTATWESPVQMFQFYAALGDDEKPIGSPELRTLPTRTRRPRRPWSSRPTRSRRTCSGGSRGSCSTAVASARRADATAKKTTPASAGDPLEQPPRGRPGPRRARRPRPAPDRRPRQPTADRRGLNRVGHHGWRRVSGYKPAQAAVNGGYLRPARRRATDPGGHTCHRQAFINDTLPAR